MLLLMAHCLDTGVCDSQKEFLESIGLPPNALRQVKTGAQGFTISQVVTACRKYKINANWILGLDSEMKRTQGKSAIQQLKDAVRAVESEL